MNYISVKETSNLLKLSERRVQELCNKGYILGCIKQKQKWLIPLDSVCKLHSVEVKKTPLKVISLFSGAGGLDIGFRQAGFEVCVAVEADSACCDTLRKNSPDLPILQGKIEDISTDEILKAGGLKPTEAALIIGGPPCQPFSLAGNREGLDDPRGKLLEEYVRVLRETLPLGFVLENVKGLMNWSNGKAKDLLISLLKKPIYYNDTIYKYNLTPPQVLNAVNYGVPQFRERVFFIGNRMGKKYSYPVSSHAETPAEHQSPYKTVWDAISELPEPTPPSETALRVSESIKGRIAKHGY